jgi:hypothetical protein
MSDYSSDFERRIAIINRSILDENSRMYRDALINTMDTMESVAMWFRENTDCKSSYTASDVVAVTKMVQDEAQTILENKQTAEVVEEARGIALRSTSNGVEWDE